MKYNDKKRIMAREVIIPLIIALIGAAFGACMNHYFSIVRNKNDYEKMNKYELLYEAYLNYTKGAYLESINIYSDEKLSEHPEALNNLAFFYTKGIGVAADYDKARDLFAKAYRYDNRFTAGIAAISVIEPRDLEETLNYIVMSLKNGDEWTAYFVDSTMHDVFQNEEKGSNEFLNLTKDEQLKVLEKALQTEYEWNSRIIESNAFYKVLPKEYERKEIIGSYESEGRREPLYGTVKYHLYRKRFFRNISTIQNGAEYQYSPHE